MKCKRDAWCYDLQPGLLHTAFAVQMRCGLYTVYVWLQVRVLAAGAYFVTPKAGHDVYVADAVVEVASCSVDEARHGLARLGSDTDSAKAFARTARGICSWCANQHVHTSHASAVLYTAGVHKDAKPFMELLL